MANETLVEHFYSQVSESIKSVFDLTSRVDERVKMLMVRQDNLDEQMEKIAELVQPFTHRIAALESKDFEEELKLMRQRLQVLEIKIETINIKTLQQESRWAQIIDVIFKLAVMLVGGFLLFKLGWQAPP